MADLAGLVRKVLPGRLFNDVVNRFEGNLNTFNNNLKERVGLDGWPPGIHGATLHDFKIPVSDMSEEMQQFIALHPLSWTPERIANMSEDYLYDQIEILLKKEGLVYRDFEMPHPAQLLGEKMVDLKVNKDGNFRTAKITYDMFLDKPTKPRTGLSKDIKKELDYLREGGDLFEPDFDLDD